uniref:Uncharacterized protein n=1 Tax=Fagus sylvatica TaxID=28930 RepID=A0A2N9HDZ8_FAGSY
MEEFKSSLRTLQRRVVGVDIKFGKTASERYSTAKILLLCAGTRCLIIQLLNSLLFSETLVKFLSDETICFLGTGMSRIVGELNQRNGQFTKGSSCYTYVECKTGVGVGYLAAKILKKAYIEKKRLAELAGEVGMDIKQPIGECPDWNVTVFSDEEIKYAMHNSYTSYVIGNKLFGMI